MHKQKEGEFTWSHINPNFHVRYHAWSMKNVIYNFQWCFEYQQSISLISQSCFIQCLHYFIFRKRCVRNCVLEYRRAWSAHGWVSSTRYKMVAAWVLWCLARNLLQVECCEVEDLVFMYGRVLSGDDGGCRQEKRESCCDVHGCVRSDRVVVIHSWCECCAQHPERTHVKLRGEASLRGCVAESIRGNLYYFSNELAFLVMQ
jgi:hypothetical protein